MIGRTTPPLGGFSFFDVATNLKQTMHPYLPPIITTIKCLNTAGQVIFLTSQAAKYGEMSEEWKLSPLTIATILASTATILICKSRAISRTFGPATSNEQTPLAVEPGEEVVMSIPGKALFACLATSSGITGLFDGIYGFLGANTLSELLFKSIMSNSTLQNIGIYIVSFMGFLVSLGYFGAYDFKEVLYKGSKRIGQHFHLKYLPHNTACVKTFMVGIPTMLIMAAQANFTASPALRSLPGLSSLDPSLTSLAAAAASIIAGTAVGAAFPSIYDAFKTNDVTLIVNNSEVETAREADIPLLVNVEDSSSTQLFRYSAYAVMTVDSLFNNGLSIFLSIFTALNEMSGREPLFKDLIWWMLTVSLFSGLFAAMLNAATVLPGYEERMQRQSQNRILEPTLATTIPSTVDSSEETTPSYQWASQIGLLFKSAFDRTKALISMSSPQDNLAAISEPDEIELLEVKPT